MFRWHAVLATAEGGGDMYEVAETLDTGSLDAIPKAISAIDRGDTLHGLIVLECVPGLERMPIAKSYLAFCMAKERGQMQEAMGLCHSALAAQPGHPAHYLNLGRVLLLAGDKPKAIATFWRGISKNAGPEGADVSSWPRNGRRREYDLIMGELRRLGIRKPPPFPSLRRGHPLNRITGKLLARIGMR